MATGVGVIDPPGTNLGPDQIRREAATIGWFHHIDLGPLTTPGATSLAHQQWIADTLPASFAGRSVLDVGAWDGFFSFLAERRGAARVLAIDELQNAVAHSAGTRGFELARRVLRSRVEYRVLSLWDAPQLHEQFDTMLLLGVYYHLVDPIEGLRRARSLLKPGGTVFLEGMYLPGRWPTLRFFTPQEEEPTTYCAGTLSGIVRVATLAGFEDPKLLSTARGTNPIIRWAVRHTSTVRSRLATVGRATGGRSFWPRAIFSFTRPAEGRGPDGSAAPGALVGGE